MCSKKNRNIIRRLKKTFTIPNRLLKMTIIVSCFLFSSFCLSCDKEEMLMNSWTLQSVKVNGNPIDSLQMKYHLLPKYTYYYFFLENSLNIETLVNGQYTASADGKYKFVNSSTLEMKFTLYDKKSEITSKIKKLTKRELNLEYEENGNKYFLKLYAN